MAEATNFNEFFTQADALRFVGVLDDIVADRYARLIARNRSDLDDNEIGFIRQIVARAAAGEDLSRDDIWWLDHALTPAVERFIGASALAAALPVDAGHTAARINAFLYRLSSDLQVIKGFISVEMPGYAPGAGQ